MGGGEGAAHEGLVAGGDVEDCAAAGDVEPSGSLTSVLVTRYHWLGDGERGDDNMGEGKGR